MWQTSVNNRLLVARRRARRFLTGRTRILFERHAGIGDILCTFPAVLAIRQKYPRSHITYATRKEFAEVVRMGRCADAIIELAGSWPQVSTREYDLVFRPLNGDEIQPPRASCGHLVDGFADAAGVTLSGRQPWIYPADALKQRCREMIKSQSARAGPIIGIHAGPSWAVREWTAEGWNRLAKLLKDELGATVVQIGSDVNTGTGPEKATRIEGVIDWVNRFSISETAAFISQLDLFIGIDSGLLHMAGAVGTPSVGLFGAVNPAWRLPPTTPSVGLVAEVPCVGCHHGLPMGHWRSGCKNDIMCMKALHAERVFLTCQQLLSRTGNDSLLRMVANSI